MSFFNDAQKDALLTGRYICSKCGARMQFEDEWEDILVCLECGHRALSLFFLVVYMRYHFDKPEIYLSMYGSRYICDHPVYNSCTLYKIGEKGLAVIQQRFDAETKSTWWSEVDPWITDALYLHPNFREYFDARSGTCTDGLYPTVTVRQIMWALKMKPIKRERWETVFDRREI